MTIDDFDRTFPVHRSVPDTCRFCGEPAQDADDHPCGECAEHCTLEAHRRAEANRRLAEQHRDAERLRQIHAAQAAQRQAHREAHRQGRRAA